MKRKNMNDDKQKTFGDVAERLFAYIKGEILK